MTATDELRRMLDERGVEWSGIGDHTVLWCRRDSKYANYDAQASDWGDKLMLSWACTPEQAIEATLGRGTCHDVRSADHTIAFECSECGCWVAYDEYWETGIYVLHETGQEHIHPRYCPNCGRRVVAGDA